MINLLNIIPAVLLNTNSEITQEQGIRNNE
jgi:hypothetical protein